MDDTLGLKRGLVTMGLLVAVTGCGDSGNNSTGGSSTDPGTTGGTGGTTTTEGTTSDNPTGSGSGTDGATGTTTGEATTGEATTGEATTTTGASSTGGDVPLPPACVAYGDKITECYDARAGMTAAQYCGESHAYYSMNYGVECVAAYEDYMVCLSALTCEELTGENPVCEKEVDALSTACAP